MNLAFGTDAPFAFGFPPQRNCGSLVPIATVTDSIEDHAHQCPSPARPVTGQDP
jgi:hypothetical protein